MGPTRSFRSTRRGPLLGASLIWGIAFCLVGCSHRVTQSEDEARVWIRLVEPVDGDSLAGRIDIAAEVDLGEIVHRVTFYADDAPIVVATQTPWATDWIPTSSPRGRVIRFRAEAIGAHHRAVSEEVAVWIAPRSDLGVRVVGPHDSPWVARSPENFLRLEACGSPAWGAARVDDTLWTGEGLPRGFRSELLPVALLPPRLQRIRASRPGLEAEGWVRPFDYPDPGTALGAAEALALVLRARDPTPLPDLLAPDARVEWCSGSGSKVLTGDELSTAFRRFFDDARIREWSFSWRVDPILEWTRQGRSWALVRASHLAWSFGIAEDACGPTLEPWTESREDVVDLLWEHNGADRWTLASWKERGRSREETLWGLLVPEPTGRRPDAGRSHPAG
ncbi:MAG: hypothetical protein R3E12_11805 [Candidatus Eisenbacteria bacterium]|uniref:Uncharacterized protein n=1 Tax=Eiseniibacteriota bacterium TaxID=2212470 RepID=A0A956RQA3_UNCEI|nr:hypothetical protein [Candidatus Eisenbacteria bacterium]